MRVLFCGCAGIFSGLVLRELLACRDAQVVAVVRSTRVLSARYGLLRGAWHQCRRSGLAYTLYLWLATGWTEALSRCGLGRLARRHGIPTLATRDINDPRGLAFVDGAGPDVLVCAYFNQRIGPSLLGRPGIVALNVHPSLLPDLKGVDPVFFARLRGLSDLGVTVHHMETELDAGGILAQQGLAVPVGESVLRTTARLFALGGRLLVSRLVDAPRLGSGRPQPGGGSYDSWPTPGQVASLRRRGVPLMRPSDLVWASRLPSSEGGSRASCKGPGS